MNDQPMHDFGVVAEHGDSFEFHIDAAAGSVCRLFAVIQTERGPRRSELAEIAGATWRKISVRVVRELVQGMNEAELAEKKAPSLKTGANRLSPLIGRELVLLLWALQEEGAEAQLETILHGWRELAREERWWLYAKAAAPGQQLGAGWRRALFHALSEASESRAETTPTEKKPEENLVALLGNPYRPEDTDQGGTTEPDAGSQPAPVRPSRRKKKKDGGSGGEPQIDLF